MNKKKETTVLLLTLLITASAIVGGLWWLNKNKSEPFILDRNNTDIVPGGNTTSPKISAGNEILISAGATPEKEAGIKAMADGNYAQADILFLSSRSASGATILKL